MAHGLVARVKAGKPVYAWDDPGTRPGASLEERGKAGRHHNRHLRYQNNQAPFYDKEALQEQLQGLQAEGIDLSEKETHLGLRLAKAQATLSKMREKKVGLSQAKMLDEVMSVFPAKAADISVGRKHRESESNGDGGGRREARSQQRHEETNFAAQDRVMELELLNSQLRKGQAEAERNAKLQEDTFRSTRAEVNKVAERLKAMPKRFTQSLQSLRDEVETLEREKFNLELAKERKTSKEADLIASAKRQQSYLGEELKSLLDEIDDVEDDRDRWKRRLRVETTRAESLRSQRDEALRALRERFGSDAVERAAFARFATAPKGSGGDGLMALSRRGWRGGGGVGSSDRDDEEDEYGDGDHDSGDRDDSDEKGGFSGLRSPKIPVSMISKALKPVYGPDYDHDGGGEGFALLTEEAVGEAVLSECGIDCSAMEATEVEGGGVGVGYDEFRAIAKRLVERRMAPANCD
ncbi:hypothetical protein Esi_0080_0105 [Ectocarpus siliculosus]|uniref:Uncharacterized protein n=1 Tax=Ectocarpus siliculosus TaxID=2880 RepID=D7G7D4_ECTSI|nr:hypothetical protein Esi_0080_0105 [Ectocarpus siliculosus]|eukprot:CBJ27685.1 hypothetical protein Esi_0080_0105 [Ectocarpus siliculosus]